MDPKEPEELFAEDQHVEITALPGWQPAHPAVRRRTRFAVWLLRKRWLQLVSLLLLGILCLALFLRATPGARLPLLSSLFASTPTNSAPGLSIDQVYFKLGPGWAHLTIDGKPIVNPPLPGYGAPLRLAPGVHRLRWQAAPFPPQTCTIAVPSTFTDTCAASETTSTPDKQRAWIVTFRASLLTLPTDQRSALTAAVAQALKQLEPGDIVNPGEHFIDTRNSSGLIAIARQQLSASFNLTLNSNLSGDESLCAGGDTNTGSCQLDGQDCHALCTQTGNLPNIWRAVALVQSSWTYAALDGQPIATSMPDELGGAEYLDHFLPLSIFWDNGNWYVQPDQEFLHDAGQIPIPCASAADNNAISNDFGSSSSQPFAWRYIAASNPADGCLLVLSAIANNSPSPTTSAQIVYLHRFGVSLAVNRLAQEYNPEMPRPDAYEMNMVRQLAAQARISL